MLRLNILAAAALGCLVVVFLSLVFVKRSACESSKKRRELRCGTDTVPNFTGTECVAVNRICDENTTYESNNVCYEKNS